MIDIVLKKDKTIRRTKHEDIYEGENKISWINVYLPETINDIDIKDYNIVLRCYINADNYIPYTLDTTKAINKIDITHEFTDKDRYIDAYLYITRANEVIGKTNTVSFRVNKAKDGSGLTPREQFDERIAELENENEGLEREVAEKETEIESKDGQISELNDEITEKDGQITELNTENTRLENLTDTQRETIQNMLDNPPQPKLYTPPVVTPSGSVQQINPPTGYDGLNNTVVDRVSAEGVGFHSEWYKEGKECLGEVGTYNPFPERSYGGIYITEVDEFTNPKGVMLYGEQIKGCNNNVVSTLITSTYIEKFVFKNCPNIKSINMFYEFCPAIRELILSEGLEYIKGCFMYTKTTLKKIYLPSTLLGFVDSGVPNVFYGCNNLEFVILGNGFNCNNLNLSSSTRYSHDTILSWFNALADRTGETAYTLTIGSTNLNKMTAEEKAIAINKNWNLA